MHRPDRPLRSAARCLLLLAPFLWAAVLVGRYGVDTPYKDQWAGESPIFEKMAQSTLGWADFFVQHNEHRIFFPRLVFYALARATHWNVRAELWTILGLTLAIACNLWRMLRATGWNVVGTGFWLFLAANVLVFSPLHHENLLWGFQIGFLLPLACMTACLWVGRAALARARFPGVFALSIVCSFSVAGGCVCWLMSLPPLRQAGGEDTWTRHRRWWIAWTVGFAGSVALYFHGYVTPTRPDVWLLLHEPLLAEKFWFTYLGLPFAFGTALDPFTVAQASAGVMLLLFVAALGYLWRWRADAALVQRCEPWLLLVSIALLNATLTTLGRAKFGLSQALNSRYVIFAVFLPIGLSFVCAAIYQHLRARTPGPARAGNIGVNLVALGSALALLHLLAAFSVVPDWKDFSHVALTSKALVETINIVDEPELVIQDVVNLPLRDKLALLDRIGYLHPPLLKSNSIDGIADPAHPPAPDTGQLEAAGTGRDLRFRVRGWAVLPEGHRPADAVLLTYDDAQGRAVIFALAEVGSAREDIALLRGDPAFLHCGWQKVVQPGKLPAGAKVIKAWSFDAETCRAYRLPGQAVLPETRPALEPTAKPRGNVAPSS